MPEEHDDAAVLVGAGDFTSGEGLVAFAGIVLLAVWLIFDIILASYGMDNTVAVLAAAALLLPSVTSRTASRSSRASRLASAARSRRPRLPSTRSWPPVEIATPPRTPTAPITAGSMSVQRRRSHSDTVTVMRTARSRGCLLLAVSWHHGRGRYPAQHRLTDSVIRPSFYNCKEYEETAARSRRAFSRRLRRSSGDAFPHFAANHSGLGRSKSASALTVGAVS